MSTVVFFGAHADDVEIGAGGTCAKLAAAGYDVHIVVATDEADAAMAHRRQLEAVAGARALGVPSNRVHFLGHPDGDMRCTRAAVGQLRSFLTREGIRPAAVFTHTDFDSHNDHVELTKIVRGSLRQMAIFKYIVRNSAVVSHFTPKMYSRVDHMLGAKSRALIQHTSQVAAGRISLDKLLIFNEHFGVAEYGQHLEAFDIEMQDGADDVDDIINIVNDAPFSRFWSPVYAAGNLTILAGDGTRTLAPSLIVDSAASAAPATLQLVTQLQAMLLATFATDTRRNLRSFVSVAPRNAARLADVKAGSALIIGAATVNKAAAEFISALPPPRFHTGVAAGAPGENPIVDTMTGRVFAASHARQMSRSTKAKHRAQPGCEDYGLITIAKLMTSASAEPIVVINVCGAGPAGLAGAFQALFSPESLTRMVDVAIEVMAGREPIAQWLVPTTPSGDPLAADIMCSITRRPSAVAQEFVAAATEKAPVAPKPVVQKPSVQKPSVQKKGRKAAATPRAPAARRSAA